MRIVLDDPAHSGSSDQLLIGIFANDGTGDQPRVAGQKLKQWAADINSMTTELYAPIQITAAETAAGVTPVNIIYRPGNVFRFYSTAQIAQTQSFSATPSLDCSAAINNAIKGASGDVYFPTGIHYIAAPIYIPSTAIANVRFVGESRTNTQLQPMANNIADALSINAMVINQAANEKFSMYRMRLTTGGAPALQTAWAGFGLHAAQPAAWSSIVNYVAGAIVTNGGSTYICTAANLNQIPPNASFWALSGTNGAGLTAATCNYIFSGSIRDCWFDAGGIQPFFVGGLNNYLVEGNTFEFCKGCFSITGGTADAHWVSNSENNSFDYFIQDTMSPNANIWSVRGLHVYTHNRGLLFQVIGAWSTLIDDVILQASTGVANLGSIGLGSFVSTNGLQISNINVLTSATLGTGATATQLTFQGCTGQISDCIFDGCDTGILLTGTAANRLHFENVEIINVLTAAQKTNVGSPSGLITADNCNWSDSQTNLVIGTTAGTYDFYARNCRFMNAGLGTAPGARNIASATSGLTVLDGCIIGQNNGSAAAQYYLDCAGTGAITLKNPVFVGAAPLGIQNPGATKLASIDEVTVTYSASMTFDTGYAERFDIVANNATAFTINAPTSAMYGKRITVSIKNTSGGALGAVTWNAVFKMATWTQPANGFERSIDFRNDGTNWKQVGQTGVDIPN